MYTKLIICSLYYLFNVSSNYVLFYIIHFTDYCFLLFYEHFSEYYVKYFVFSKIYSNQGGRGLVNGVSPPLLWPFYAKY